jgi:ribonuclease E
MERDTEAAPAQGQPSSGLPPIFQRPTYPTGEPATREVAPKEPPRESERDGAPDRVEATDRDETPDRGGGDGSGPRRRRRGGRGRGGRGRGGTSSSTETTAARSDTKTDEPARSERAGRDAESETEVRTDAPTDGQSEGQSGEKSEGDGRRRRRGGRGRGGRGRAQGTTSDEQTPASQWDDAQPDAAAVAETRDEEEEAEAASRRRSRRRGGRGRGRSGTEADPEPKVAPERSRGPRSLEEQVASGGPTRGLRSRSLRGRGRRQREPQIVPPRITDKLMVITEHGERDQIAVLEEDVLVQHYVTRRGAHSMVGNVYLGRIQNVLPGMEAAFVDIGRGRNGVLYAGEVNYSPEDLEGGRPPRIERVLKNGQAVMVQVTKDPMGGKGARLTAQISLPGRYLVLAPEQDASGISRRLSEAARKRLKSILNKVKPKSHGVIVRTAAEGASEEEITEDLSRLIALWDQIQKAAKKAKAPAVLYEEPELTVRVVRDLFTDEEFRGLVTDSDRVHDKVMEYVRDIAPDLAPKVTLHRGPLSAFEEHRIVEQIHKALDRKVWLSSGGYLIIEQTEAMTIVDVNTGKATGKTNLEETVLTTNLEAAKEVARQLRLRDIGGIIVIDFIDLLLEQNKRKVEDTMREALAIDKTRSQVFEIGPLGLMQVTRKRVSEGLVGAFSETCPTCEGRGIIVSYDDES